MIRQKKRTLRNFFRRYIKLAVLLFVAYMVIYFTFYMGIQRENAKSQQEADAIGAKIYLETVMGNLSETVFGLQSNPAISRIMYAPLSSDSYDYVLAFRELERQVSQLKMVESCYLYIRSSDTVLASGYGKCDISTFYDASFLRSIDLNKPVSLSVHRPAPSVTFVPTTDYVTLTVRFSTILRENAGYICLNLSKNALLENLSSYTRNNQTVLVKGIEGPLFGTGALSLEEDRYYRTTESLNSYGLTVTVAKEKDALYKELLLGFGRDSMLFVGFSVLFGILLSLLIGACNKTLRAIVFQLAGLYHEADDSERMGLEDLHFYFDRLVSDSRQNAQRLPKMALVARDKLLLDLLWGINPEAGEHKENCQLLGLSFSEPGFFTAHFLMEAPETPPEGDWRENAGALLKQALQQELPHSFSVTQGEGAIALLIHCPLSQAEQLEEEFSVLVDMLLSRLRQEWPDMQLYAGFDGPIAGRTQISDSYIRAKRRARWSRALKTQLPPLPERDAPLPESPLLSKETVELVQAAVGTGSRGALYAAAGKLSSVQPELLRLQLGAMAMLVLSCDGREISSTTAGEFVGEFERLFQAPDPERMRNAFGGLLKIALPKEYKQQTAETGNTYVSRAIEFLSQGYLSDLSVGHVAEFLNLNEKYLSRLFKDETGKTMMNYLSELRMSKAVELLRESQLTVREIGEQVGFSDSRSFIRHFKRIYGITPGEYRAQNAQAVL